MSSFAFQALFVVTAGWFGWTRIQNFFLPALPVKSVVTEGGIVRWILENHTRLRYWAGQFAFLRFPQPELRGEEHPFSFTSAPQEPEVKFAIRALGDFTARLPLLRTGDLVRVNGGFGAFHPDPGSEPLALIGSGIGAAPLISILKDIAHREPAREVVCLLSMNTRAELIEPEALAGLRTTMSNLKLRIFIDEEDRILYGTEVFT